MKRDKLLRTFTPFLLIAVAVLQLYLVYTKNLTPWKGGGFGMFASIDRMERRPVHLTVHYLNKRYVANPVQLLSSNRKYERIQSMPHYSILKEFATSAYKTLWIVDSLNKPVSISGDFQNNSLDDKRLFKIKPVSSPGKELKNNLIRPDSVTVEVFRMIYSTNTNQLAIKRLNKITVSEK